MGYKCNVDEIWIVLPVNRTSPNWGGMPWTDYTMFTNSGVSNQFPLIYCEVYAKATLRSVRCRATQTQNTQQKSSTATIQRSNPGGKLKAPKLDDGSGGFPPFRFGKGGGGGGGGGGGSNYFGGFLLFACVLLLDYVKEFEKNLLLKGIV